jgi:hypothetical protein
MPSGQCTYVLFDTVLQVNNTLTADNHIIMQTTMLHMTEPRFFGWRLHFFRYALRQEYLAQCYLCRKARPVIICVLRSRAVSFL